MKILLFDDSYEYFESANYMLIREGYTVDIIDNSLDAYNKTENIDGYDVILLDLMFIAEGINLEENPEVGILLYKRIRNRNKKIPIIIVSALNEKRLMNYWDKDENTTYISKPLSQEAKELINAIKSLTK